MENIWIFIAPVLAGIVALILGILLQKKRAENDILLSKQTGQKIVADAQNESKSIVKMAEIDAKDYVYKAKNDFENECKSRQQDLQKQEKRLISREENVDRKLDLIDRKELDIIKRDNKLNKREHYYDKKQTDLSNKLEEVCQQLEKISGMTQSDAKRELINNLVDEAKHEAAKHIKQIEDEAKEQADRKAKDVIGLAIQRYAGEYVSERTVSVVDLPNDEMKGRIIGREGRNIRALESATGVDLIIDDTPQAVIISSFNPIRREVARLALEKLVTDGRIHPARIEEIVNKTSQEVSQFIKEMGDKATFDLGLHGIHPELIKYLGRLKLRTSFAQNQWQHSIEVGFLCGIMAAELGINQKHAKRAGLLHDIGKAIDHEVDGSHAVIGAELAKKYGESPKIVHAIRAHHEDEKPNSLLAVMVQAADALSGARPGARHEALERYVSRLDDLEKICKSFNGVYKAYAIQAGRELRIIVDSPKVSDNDVVVLSKNIAQKVETELTYPGQIKITVIRETRAVEYAK